ncbi:nucleotidyltransferase family protein [Kordiimonas marina]|uniref:nucleotidyltransferase family protein n=1 Tax=Kordiimonas marina TaxID=2872312 RepID=UPI001FF5AC8A|nr:nucleotidyltransferase family protein [Kordiimonas marina]MCJ9428804.1 nucleotidyltransferase family protein [Kordiimonas marina]
MNDVAVYDFDVQQPMQHELAQPVRQNYDNVRIFTAVVLAGSRHADDAVASMFDQPYKALVPIEGAPMISRVVAALRASRSIRRILVVFDDADVLKATCPDLMDPKQLVPVEVLPCADTICGSVAAALEETEGAWPYLVTTADHALLTPTMVDRFCTEARYSAGVSIGLVERRHIEAQHEGSKRTYLPFRGEGFSGANLFAFMGPEAAAAIAFWKRIENERKKPWKLFAAFGFRNLAGLLFRRFTVEQAFERASRTLGVQATAVKLPFAEAAIDVDSPADYHQVSNILSKRRSTIDTFRHNLELELSGSKAMAAAE